MKKQWKWVMYEKFRVKFGNILKSYVKICRKLSFRVNFTENFLIAKENLCQCF